MKGDLQPYPDFWKYLLTVVDMPAKHFLLFEMLCKKEFKVGEVTRDINRVQTAVVTRESYNDFVGPPSFEDTYMYERVTADPQDIRVIEIIMEVASNMAFIVGSVVPQNDPTVSVCFWILLNNLGITDIPVEEAEVIVDKFIQREYEPSGLGGLFPLHYPEEDQRDVEIWMQMQAWFGENYTEE